jgi:anti-sigma regulatory factor (Ser/Thr protein kinase)/PAS domain-containing protein
MSRKSPASLAFALALALIATLPLAAQGDPFHVNLNDWPLYVKTGFDLSAIDKDPEGQPGWKVLPPTGESGRYARPIELDLPGVPKRPPFSLASYPQMEFTYLIPFDFPTGAANLLRSGRVRDGVADAAPVPGLHFAGLGDNWEIFLNGTKVREELHLDAKGAIASHRSIRDVRFPLPGSLFRPGRNILAIRIIADPTFPPAGLHQSEPYFVGSYSDIERRNLELIPVLLCGLYLFIGLYHLFMYLVRPVDRHNLFYGLFSMDLAVYLFVRTHTAILLIPDSDTIFRIELASLSMILPFVGAFLETLNDNKVLRRTMAYGAFSALIALLEVVMPVAFAHDLLRVWQFTGLVAALYYFGWEILGRFLSDGLRRWKRMPEEERKGSLAKAYLVALGRTPIGNLLMGGLILFATAIFDIIDALYMQWDLVLTQYGFFVFTMGTALILANRFGFLHDRLRGLNTDLEDRIERLTQAGESLAASERKYKSLFHGSTDPLALLDTGLRFIEGNKAAVELFGLDRPGSRNASLEGALYVEERDAQVQAERLRRVISSPEPGDAAKELPVMLRTPLGEPKACRLRFEHIASPSGTEILLRVLPEAKDGLADFFIEGRERYDIESTLSAAEDLCRRACARLPHYFPEEDAGFLEICLREMVINAVEHGNLEVGFDDKTQSQREGRYFDFIQKRRLEPAFRDRKVTLEYSISAERATFRVTDMGKGFDHRSFVGQGQPSPEMFEHGRGLFMTLNAFDRVVYNDKGNQVTLVKYCKREAAPSPSPA